MCSGQLQHVARADSSDIECLNRMRQIVLRARQRGHVEETIHGAARQLAVKRKIHVMLDKLECGDGAEVLDVLERACKHVVERDDRMTLEKQTIAHVRADEPGCTGNYDFQTVTLRTLNVSTV